MKNRQQLIVFADLSNFLKFKKKTQKYLSFLLEISQILEISKILEIFNSVFLQFCSAKTVRHIYVILTSNPGKYGREVV